MGSKKKSITAATARSKWKMLCIGAALMLAVAVAGGGYAQDITASYLPTGTDCVTTGMAPYTMINGVGHVGHGAGLAIADINRNGVPDMVLMAYDGPARANNFRYKIGWDVNFSTGYASSWMSNYHRVSGVGWEGQGAGISIVDIDGNGILDMVLMAYDNPAGANNFRYKIGWNLNTSGVAASWSNHVQIDGVGDEGDGAGIAITDIDGNGQLDILLAAYHRPPGGNSFRYRIGWNIGTDGKTTNWTTNYIWAPGMGNNAQGADVVIADMDLDGNQDLVLMCYDNPAWNNFRYRIGWNLQANGRATEWSRYFMLKGVGMEGDGAGLAHYCYERYGESTPLLIFMAYDDPAGDNNFRYFKLPVTTSGACFGVADDPPPWANNVLSVPTDWNNQNGTRLFNLNMQEVQQVAQDALALFWFGCFFAQIFGDPPPLCWFNHPDSDVTFVDVSAHDCFSFKNSPDMMVAAVASYVHANMGWVNDAANSWVLNSFHNLNYFAGAEGMPAYYTIHYTDPARYPDLLTQLQAQDPNWANAYNDGRMYHGDCEDFAILRHALLRALGFDRDYIWNGRAPGHEFNVVLYKGAYRIMDYGQIYGNFCQPSGIVAGLDQTWNQSHGPRFSGNCKQWFQDYVLNRVYPDRCGVGYGWNFTRRAKPDLDWDSKCP